MTFYWWMFGLQAGRNFVWLGGSVVRLLRLITHDKKPLVIGRFISPIPASETSEKVIGALLLSAGERQDIKMRRA